MAQNSSHCVGFRNLFLQDLASGRIPEFYLEENDLPPCSAINTKISSLHSMGGYSWWGVGKVEPEPELFFLMPTPAQLSAYANHEFKIIPTPTQLSAYANHKLKNRYYLAKVLRS